MLYEFVTYIDNTKVITYIGPDLYWWLANNV